MKNITFCFLPLLQVNSRILFSHWTPFIKVILFPNFSLKYFLSLWTQRVQTDTVTMGDNFWASGQDFLSFSFLSFFLFSLSLFFLLFVFCLYFCFNWLLLYLYFCFILLISLFVLVYFSLYCFRFVIYYFHWIYLHLSLLSTHLLIIFILVNSQLFSFFISLFPVSLPWEFLSLGSSLSLIFCLFLYLFCRGLKFQAVIEFWWEENHQFFF